MCFAGRVAASGSRVAVAVAGRGSRSQVAVAGRVAAGRGSRGGVGSLTACSSVTARPWVTACGPPTRGHALARVAEETFRPIIAPVALGLFDDARPVVVEHYQFNGPLLPAASGDGVARVR